MSALIVVDVQHDFMPGGALSVPHGDEIIPYINAMMPNYEHVIATQDWHPANHVSFAKTHGKNVGEMIDVKGIEQRLWPVHCVQDSHGANLAKGLHKTQIEIFFHKGTDPDVDSYSTFFDNVRERSTGLEDYLRKKGIKELDFVGLATDYCVLYSVLDALELGFKVKVHRSGCRAIGDDREVLWRMQQKGAVVVL